MKIIKHRIAVFFLLLFFPAFLLAQTEEEALALREALVAQAKQYVGVPYAWGGTTTAGMDCSGFIYTASRNSVGVQLPRTTQAMYGFMRIVPDSKKEIGDVLFFKTVGDSISHAGIYIGNEQFIHSASDGPNTGVIVSSLNQATWKNTYAGVGQFLPSAMSSEVPSTEKDKDSSAEQNNSTAPTMNRGLSFLDNTVIDFTGTMIWNFYSTDSFFFNVRGGTIQAHIKYTDWDVEPGFGIEFRFEPSMNIVQIPLQFSISVPYGFRVYAGPVLTLGDPVLIGSEEAISASVFPGILGLSWQSPGISAGPTEISFVQDIAWTVFNKTDNSALHIGNAFVAGLVFSTGVRVSIDGSHFIR